MSFLRTHLKLGLGGHTKKKNTKSVRMRKNKAACIVRYKEYVQHEIGDKFE